MNAKRIIGILILAISILASCRYSETQKRDVMLEAAQSFDYIFDAPLSKGKRIYDKYCSVCHGTDGKGYGFNAYNLNPRPRNFTDSSFVARLDTNLIIETISRGGSAVGLSSMMPPWGNTLDKSEIKLVSDYVVKLSRSSGD